MVTIEHGVLMDGPSWLWKIYENIQWKSWRFWCYSIFQWKSSLKLRLLYLSHWDFGCDFVVLFGWEGVRGCCGCFCMLANKKSSIWDCVKTQICRNLLS